MIWNSVTTTTVIDLLILAGLCVCLHVYFRFSRRLYGRRSHLGPLLILLGVGLISLVHVADLAIMHVLPMVMPEADQAAVMEVLHLDWSWISTLLGTGFIIIGFILINRNTFAAMRRLESLENSLAAERSTRVSERDAVHLREASLVNAQRIARIGNWDWDIVNDQVHWSEEMYRIYGLDPGGFGATYEAFLDAVHPDDRNHVRDNVTRALGETGGYSTQFRIVQPDGSVRFVHNQGEVDYGDAGKPKRMSGTVQDITEQKQAEESLRASEARFRDLIEGSDLGIQIMGEDGKRLFVNQACARLFGYDSTDEIINGPSAMLAAPHERKRLREGRAALFRGEDVPRDYAFDGMRKDGGIIPVRAFKRRLVWEGREAVQQTFIDLTERKRAEEALRASEARFRDFAEASSDWFWEFGPDLRFTWISDRMFDLSGHRRASYIGKTSRELGPPIVERRKWENYLAELDAHRPVRGFYFKRIGRGGEERHIRLSAKPVFAADGSFQGYRGTGREFTTATAAAEQVERIQDQFLNAIKNISEGIALYDDDERLVFCNNQYGTFAGKAQRHLSPGMTFEEFLRESIAIGRTELTEDQV